METSVSRMSRSHRLPLIHSHWVQRMLVLASAPGVSYRLLVLLGAISLSLLLVATIDAYLWPLVVQEVVPRNELTDPNTVVVVLAVALISMATVSTLVLLSAHVIVAARHAQKRAFEIYLRTIRDVNVSVTLSIYDDRVRGGASHSFESLGALLDVPPDVARRMYEHWMSDNDPNEGTTLSRTEYTGTPK